MNISRIALLSAVFCATSMFGSEVSSQPGMISQVYTTVVVNPFNFVKNNTFALTDFIAGYSVNLLLNHLANISYLQGGTIQSYIQTDANGVNPMGRLMVLSAAAYATYKAMQALDDQNVDNDDEIIFVDEEYVE
ncbi:MAG TPA: hypothetical protein VHX42_02720 [Candidatus Babeliales bacterium]|jgi:hypothetical protein|nr:hypothetical protein [Candidatus Babeliales bacterium]